MRNPAAPFIARAAERQVCAWALQNHKWLDDSLGTLRVEHFEDSRLAALYGQIIAMRAKGMLAKPDTLESWASTREDWSVDDLFALLAEGRTGSLVEFDANIRAIVKASDGRTIMATLDDARAHVIESSEDEPAVIASRIEGLFRSALLSSGTKAAPVAQLGASYLKTLQSNAAAGFRTGFAELDARHGSFIPGELIILAGETASGKTTVATNLARRWASDEFVDADGQFISLNGRPLRGHFASYEMGEAQIIPRMWSAISYAEPDIRAFEYTSLRRADHDVTDETLAACQRVLTERYSTLLIDVTPAQTLADLEASVRETKRTLGGIDFIVVDYLQRMRSNAKTDRHLQIAEITSGLKDMAQRYGAVVVALAQINRQNQQRHDKRPQRSDMRESASIEHDADVILANYRPARELELELRAAAASDETSDVEYFQLEARVERERHSLEMLTLKARQGPEGVDHLHVNLAYDTIRDGAKPKQRTRRA